MKVMPSVLGQIGQNVADNLFEIGKSAIAGTAKVATDIAGETIEQITSAPSVATTQMTDKPTGESIEIKEKRKERDRQRLQAVQSELAQYRAHLEQINRKMAEEKAEESQQKKVSKERARESWLGKMINRSQTTTEKGRLQE